MTPLMQFSLPLWSRALIIWNAQIRQCTIGWNSFCKGIPWLTLLLFLGKVVLTKFRVNQVKSELVKDFLFHSTCYLRKSCQILTMVVIICKIKVKPAYKSFDPLLIQLLSLVEITAFRLESKFFTNESTLICKGSHEFYLVTENPP